MPVEGRRETAVVVEKTYDFLLWLLPKVEKFPRAGTKQAKGCVSAGIVLD